MTLGPSSVGQFRRLRDAGRSQIQCTIDGHPVIALAGDTVLTALLTHKRFMEAELGEDGRLRSAFCLMGACQECWTRLAEGTVIRACTSRLEPGMHIVTTCNEHVNGHELA